MSVLRLGVLATHPIQYHAPLFRALAREIDLTVFFAQRQTREGQSRAGFGVEFEWDVPLLDGYEYRFLSNRSPRPDVSTFGGCDTPEIYDVIRNGRFDAFLVTGWYNKSFLQAIWGCRRSETPLMVRGDSQLDTPRSPVKRAAKEIGYRAFLRAFDRCCYVGTRSRDYFVHYGVPSERLVFVPHFVDTEFFSDRAAKVDREIVRGGLGISDADHVLLFVGKFIPEKSPTDVVRAAAQLQQRGASTVCLFVGDGPLKSALEEESRRVGVRSIFAGFKNQSELPSMYVAGDVLMLPSASETWGLVVNEAFACGLPAVVADPVGCSPDLIHEPYTGAVHEYGNTTSMASAVMRARDIDRDERLSKMRGVLRRYSVSTACRAIVEAGYQLSIYRHHDTAEVNEG
jgi:glycosyltransferase involved in cell wall biosynthesis